MYLPQTLLVSAFVLHLSLALLGADAQELRPTRRERSLYQELMSELRGRMLMEDGRMRFGKRSMNRLLLIPLNEIDEYFRKYHM